MARMQLLPAERMLASVEPGYKSFDVTGTLHVQMNRTARPLRTAPEEWLAALWQS